MAISAVVAVCEDRDPPLVLPPNPVGNTLRLAHSPDGHVLLTWDAPPVDAGHDPATLYRLDQATVANGPFVEVGSSTVTSWTDVDGAMTTGVTYFLVRAENAGGGE